MSLDKNLARLRKEHGLSQERLAELLGISRQAISKWESGITYPEISNMQELAKLYGITLDELLNDDLSELKVEVKMNEKKCVKCGTICDKSDVYCSECGSNLLEDDVNITIQKTDKKKCQYCGSECEDDDIYCPECGSDLFENGRDLKKKRVVKKKYIYILLGSIFITIGVIIYILSNKDYAYGSANFTKMNIKTSVEEKYNLENDYKKNPKNYVENYLLSKGILTKGKYKVEEEVGMSDNPNMTVYHFFYNNGGTIGWYMLDKTTGDIYDYMQYDNNANEISYIDESNLPQQNKESNDSQLDDNEQTTQEETKNQEQEKQWIQEDYAEFKKIINFVEQNLDTPPNDFYNTVMKMSDKVNWKSKYSREFKDDIFYVYSGVIDIHIPANKEITRKSIIEVKGKWENKIQGL